MINGRSFFVQNPALPTWLVKALNLSTSQVPQNLKLEKDESGGPSLPAITPVLDVYQGGLALAQLTPINLLSDDAVTFAGGFLILPADPLSSYLVLSLFMSGVGLAADRTGQLEFVNPNTGVFGGSLVECVVPMAGGLTWTEINGAPSPALWVPPGFTLTLTVPALAPGEQVAFVGLALKVPLGFKPF